MSLEVRIRKKLSNFILNVEFEVETGEVTALLGASGCGKSMTLKCIAGIEHPDEGRIVLDGRVLFDSEKRVDLPPQKRHVGYMFQDYALFPNMTVRQNVMTGMGKHPDPEEVDRILHRFKIEEIEGVRPAKLSGGQKQRAAMARLAAQKPEVILLDEPFSALDSHLKWELEREMKEILTELDRPSIFVSHDRDEVYHLCGTVCCLNRGQIEVIEPLKDFFSDPKTKTAAILSGCKNISKVHRVDEHTLYAEDWKLTIPMKNVIPEGIAWIGIRAHSFKTESASDRDLVIPVIDASAAEDPFEWTISFRAAEGGGHLSWMITKELMKTPVIPDHIYLNSAAIMLLGDTGGKEQ